MFRYLAVLATLFCAPAYANLVTNGSFETLGDAGTTTRYGPGNPAGFGWTVGGAGIDVVGGYWAAKDGINSLDLNPDTHDPDSLTPPGSVSQSLATAAGSSYLVSFWMAGNPDHSESPRDGAAVKSMTVSLGGTSFSYAFDVTGHTLADPGWLFESFTATGAGGDLLSFTSTSPGYAGMIIDNVSVTELASSTAVPEPGTAALLIVGGLLAICRRPPKTVRSWPMPPRRTN